MPEIRAVKTLRRKRNEIVSSIRLYARQLEQAKTDLAHVMATIRLFEASGDPKDISPLHRYASHIQPGETWVICKAVLERNGAMTTKELAVELMQVKDLETGDRALARALGQKLVNFLGKQRLRGALVCEGKRKSVNVWRLPVENTRI